MPSSNGQLPRLALIGVTGYGTIYLDLVREALRQKTIRLIAAVIINQDQVPEIVAELKAGGAVIYPDADSFFTAQRGCIDLCLIPVAIQWHARLTISALHAGMNVLVEKPLAGSVADTLAIRDAETASGRWVAVGFQDLYSLEARWLKTQLLAGAIGRLESVRMIGLWPRHRSYFSRNHWAGRLQADGAPVLDSPLNNAFAHFINLSLYLAGPAIDESTSARLESAELLRAHSIETFDTALVSAVAPSGTRLWFGVSHSTESTREPEIYLKGTGGTAEWWHEQRCVLVDADGRRQVFRLPTATEARQLMFAAVLERLEDPSVFVCTTDIAEQHTRLIEAVHKAGSTVNFPKADIEWVFDSQARSERPVVHGLDDRLNSTLLNPFAPSVKPVAREALSIQP